VSFLVRFTTGTDYFKEISFQGEPYGKFGRKRPMKWSGALCTQDAFLVSKVLVIARKWKSVPMKVCRRRVEKE
jgi:hypothetical protein